MDQMKGRRGNEGRVQCIALLGGRQQQLRWILFLKDQAC